MAWDITGMAAISAIGDTPDTIFDALCQRRSGVAELRAFDTTKYRARHAYEIDDRGSCGDRPFRATRWLQAVIAAALDDAGLPPTSRRYPVIVGTTLREQRSVELWWKNPDTGIPDTLAPERLDFAAALRETAQLGDIYTVANACAASLYALGMATDLLELGTEDTVIVAGTDSITESAFGTFDRVQTGTPHALRPFDTGRAGMVMGEGAVAVVLRRAGNGDRAHARVRGVAMNCDGRHATAPDQASIQSVVADAHQRAGVDAHDIDLVMAHGSGTRLNDRVEASALTETFGALATPPVVTAIKSMTGHTLGGSGLLSLVMAAIALRTGVVPPILGLTDRLAEAATLTLAHDLVEADLAMAQIDAFGFGGINAVAVIEKGSP